MEWQVEKGEAGHRLDKFLAAAGRMGSRARAADALERGKVIVNGIDQALSDASRRLGVGDCVRVWMDRPGSARKPLRAIAGADLRIVYEDSALLVLDKPAGLLAVPLDRRRGAASVYDLIEERLRSHGKQRPFVVHRIDRDTSGLVMFARDEDAQAALKAQFKRREPERVYLAVVHGQPTPSVGEWRDYLVWDEAASIQKPARPRDPRAMEAISRYRVLETFDSASLVEVRLHTGKRNQIRIQAQLRGHTLIGEKRYVADSAHTDAIPFARQALHAHRLAFEHPLDRRPLRFESPLPPDITDLLTRLRTHR